MSSQTYPFVGVHLDLKYLMPRKEYLHQWLREIVSMGINTLLLEYEDKFPYQQWPYLRAQDAFSPEELRDFLRQARDCGLRVIPLVQSFSHLEFALAHEQLAHLREAPDVLTQINPSNPEALRLVHDMIDEVLAYHQEDEYFHLGADETWFIGTNPEYADEVKALGLPAYWAKHLQPYIEHVKKAEKRPMVWDDVFWDDPACIEAVDLPRDVVLMSWEYSASELTPDNDPLARVDIYKAAGYEVIGAPCLNWGVLTPMHDHCLANTATWAQKVKRSELAGIVNTAWACFHTPLPTQMPYIRATAALLEDDAPDLNDAWISQWSATYFGIEDAGLAGALRDLSLNWEQKIQGLKRPITPIVYGYTDLILHYESQVERMKCGAYPLDWNDVDFNAMYLKKIDLLGQLEDRDALAAKLQDLLSAHTRASEFLSDFSLRAEQHQQEAHLLSCLATLKVLHGHALECLLFGIGEKAVIRRGLDQHKIEMEKCLSPFYEAPSLARLGRLWWEPALLALSQEETA